MKRRHRRKQVPGTIRFKGEWPGRYVYAAPEASHFMRVLLLATEYYDGRKWLPFDHRFTMEERNNVSRQVRDRKPRNH